MWRLQWVFIAGSNNLNYPKKMEAKAFNIFAIESIDRKPLTFLVDDKGTVWAGKTRKGARQNRMLQNHNFQAHIVSSKTIELLTFCLDKERIEAPLATKRCTLLNAIVHQKTQLSLATYHNWLWDDTWYFDKFPLNDHQKPI